MDKALRLYKLKRLLIESRLPISINSVKSSLDCSEKTVRRLVKTLEDDYQAPWFIYQNQIHLDEARQHNIELQDFWFSHQEIESLFTLNQIIEQLSPGVLHNQLEPFKKRIQGLIEGESSNENIGQKIKLIEIADRQINPEIFQWIAQALIENKQIKIEFWNRYKDETRLRTISPQRLVRYKDNWIVDSYCHWRKAIRSFSLEAILSLEMQQTPSKNISQAELTKHFESTYGIYAGKATQRAVIKFSPYIARWVQHENWHPDQIGHWDIDQSYQLTIPYQNDQELIQDILKYGAEAEVLSPLELREKIVDQLKKSQAIYAGTRFDPGF